MFSTRLLQLHDLSGSVRPVFLAELLQNDVPVQSGISAHLFEKILPHRSKTGIISLRQDFTAVDPEDHFRSWIIDHKANCFAPWSEEKVIDISVGFKHLGLTLRSRGTFTLAGIYANVSEARERPTLLLIEAAKEVGGGIGVTECPKGVPLGSFQTLRHWLLATSLFVKRPVLFLAGSSGCNAMRKL
jgi:hypothetical protein